MSKRVANTVFSELRKGGATRRELLAAGVTGLVESNFENLPGGDRDSQGWRQERKQFYSNPRNVRAAARRFLSEAKEFRGQGLSVGELAQAVQQSGFPDKYQPRLGEARRLLAGVGSSGSSGGGGIEAVTGSYKTPDLQRTDFRAALAQSFLSGGRNPLLAAMQAAGSGAFDYTIPGKKINIPDPYAGEAGTRGGTSGGVGDGGGGGGSGSVKVGPNANRKGVNIQPVVMDFLGHVSGLYGKTITIGTGTNHDRMTSSNNVSDHWDGNGADIPSAGLALTRMGRAALVAAGMPRSKARKIKGGAFTLTRGGKRIQIIFNSNVGGNHYDHLHVGIR